MNSLLQRIAKDITEAFVGSPISDAERYVNQSADTSDVERRIREVERAQAQRSI